MQACIDYSMRFSRYVFQEEDKPMCSTTDLPLNSVKVPQKNSRITVRDSLANAMHCFSLLNVGLGYVFSILYTSSLPELFLQHNTLKKHLRNTYEQQFL